MYNDQKFPEQADVPQPFTVKRASGAHDAFIAKLKADVRAEMAWRRRGDPSPRLFQGVYFFQVESGPIKIGIAAKPEIRLAQVRVSNHEHVRLIGLAVGGDILEKLLHETFAEDRIRGEWFRPSERLLAVIEGLGQGNWLYE
ncbi:MAG TPA: GIY-YIG nuclease family protein [Gemmatimonadales bacterium]